MIALSAEELPGGLEFRPDLEDQPEHVHHLLEQLEDHGLIEVAEEGPILYVVTWLLNHPHFDICTAPRVLRLTGAFELWHHQFLMLWSDRLEEGRPVNFYLVFPTATNHQNAAGDHAAPHSPLRQQGGPATLFKRLSY